MRRLTSFLVLWFLAEIALRKFMPTSSIIELLVQIKSRFWVHGGTLISWAARRGGPAAGCMWARPWFTSIWRIALSRWQLHQIVNFLTRKLLICPRLLRDNFLRWKAQLHLFSHFVREASSDLCFQFFDHQAVGPLMILNLKHRLNVICFLPEELVPHWHSLNLLLKIESFFFWHFGGNYGFCPHRHSASLVNKNWSSWFLSFTQYLSLQAALMLSAGLWSHHTWLVQWTQQRVVVLSCRALLQKDGTSFNLRQYLLLLLHNQRLNIHIFFINCSS